MTPDQYLFSVLQREQVDNGPYSPARAVANVLAPVLTSWGNGNINSVQFSGSFAKGTANRSGTDVDLFVSLSQDTPGTLDDMYNTLLNALKAFSPRKQNVSVGTRVGTYKVDVTPGKLRNATSNDHSIYRTKDGTPRLTDVAEHVRHVTRHGRQQESRLFKLWRSQRGLEWPSFYIELVVINALAGKQYTLSSNVMTVLEYIRDNILTARAMDPANTNNNLADDLFQYEKTALRDAAIKSLSSPWTTFVT